MTKTFPEHYSFVMKGRPRGGRVMRAIRVNQYGGPEVLRLEEVPMPAPGPGQVLIKNAAIGVNPVDTYICNGANPAIKPPYTPGLDCAGTIEAVGPGVSEAAIGDKVYTGSALGAYAEYSLCSLKRTYKMPGTVSFKEAAAIGVNYATAYRALVQRAAAESGESVLIHGATGGVGIAAIQLAKTLNLKVYATGSSKEGLELIKRQGATEVFDHSAPDYLQSIKSTAPGGINIILEMLANVNLGKDLPLLAQNGRVIIIGSRGNVEITPRDLMTREADVRGISLFNLTDDQLEDIHRTLGAQFESNILKPIIGREFPLGDAAQAHVAVMSSGARGKILLIP